MDDKEVMGIRDFEPLLTQARAGGLEKASRL